MSCQSKKEYIFEVFEMFWCWILKNLIKKKSFIFSSSELRAELSDFLLITGKSPADHQNESCSTKKWFPMFTFISFSIDKISKRKSRNVSSNKFVTL
jgi:hypothetical protein